MKKRVITLVTVAIISEIVAISIVLTLFTYWMGNETVANAGNVSNNLNTNASANNHFVKYENNDDSLFNIKAYIGLSDDVVTIKESIKLDNKHSVSNNSLNSYEVNKINSVVNGAVYLYVPSLNVANTVIKNIYAENVSSELTTIKNWEINGLVLEIQIPTDMIQDKVQDKAQDIVQANRSSYIHIEYEISLNKNMGTISISDNQILLTNFLITPAIYRNNKPILTYKSRFGDPYVYESNNYLIVFYINKNMEVFTPGEKLVDDNIDENMQKIVFKADNLRDFPVVIARNVKDNFTNYDIYVEKVNDTEIYFINCKDVIKYVKDAFLFANKKIGPYPYKKFFVVKASIPSLKGMEFSNMIFIADRCFNDNKDLRRVLYHEVFHQWFYGIIGTDQINEPFMDEGLVNYLAIMLNGDKLDSKYNDEFFDMELKSYKSKDEYCRLAYIDAAIYFANIHKKLGNDFYKLLQNIYKEKKFSIIYFDEFEQHLFELQKSNN